MTYVSAYVVQYAYIHMYIFGPLNYTQVSLFLSKDDHMHTYVRIPYSGKF